jgi:hypothetical protein
MWVPQDKISPFMAVVTLNKPLMHLMEEGLDERMAVVAILELVAVAVLLICDLVVHRYQIG